MNQRPGFNFDVWIEVHDWERAVSIWLADVQGGVEIVKITVETGPCAGEGQAMGPAPITVSSLFLQTFLPRLIQAARNAHLLPPEPPQVKEDVEALKAHIKDLRDMLGLGDGQRGRRELRLITANDEFKEKPL
jgi:hypothetical protein